MDFLSSLFGKRAKQAKVSNLRVFVVCLICFKPDRPNFQHTQIFNCLSASSGDALEQANTNARKQLGDDVVVKNYQIGEIPSEMIKAAYLSGLAGGHDA